MKKIICIILSLLLVGSMLAACAKTADTESGTETANETAANTDTGDQDPETTDSGLQFGPGGEQPGDPPEGGPGGNPPEGGPGGNFPDGTPPAGGPGGNPPEGGPDGTPPDGTPPAGGPGGNPPEGGPGGNFPDGTPPAGGPGGPGGQGGADIEYSGAAEITEPCTQESMTYESTASDQSALIVTADGEVTITGAAVTKTGNSDGGDSCSFYGLNAAVLAKDGTKLTIIGGTVSSSATGANGVFCYGGNGGRNGAEGDGTTVTIRDTVINTTGDGSGGIMTTGGGVTYAYGLTVTTSGRSSAAIRSDRGGGQVYVDGGSYTTSGLGSPAIYSTASIEVKNAKLVSNLSEGIVIEGKNSVTLTNCDLTANNTDCNSNAQFHDSIMLFQSMSGDAETGTASFTMTGGSLTSKSGHVFHVTNTNAVITLEGVSIVNEDKDDVLLSVCADGWSGSANRATLNAIGQKLAGVILVGSDSYLTLDLSDGSSFIGSIGGSITNAKGSVVSTEVGSVSVTIDAGSTWTLTADTYITEFNGSASSVISNGYTLYVNGVALTGTK